MFAVDVDGGGGVMGSTKITDSNTNTAIQNIQGYWDDFHTCGYWWDVPDGTEPQSLFSNSGSGGGGTTSSWKFSLVFVNCTNARKRLLGHHYSIKPSGIGLGGYYDEPHATISNDGKLVMFTSNMNKTTRHETFVMELPRT
jgi:hypothetical protein